MFPIGSGVLFCLTFMRRCFCLHVFPSAFLETVCPIQMPIFL